MCTVYCVLFKAVGLLISFSLELYFKPDLVAFIRENLDHFSMCAHCTLHTAHLTDFYFIVKYSARLSMCLSTLAMGKNINRRIIERSNDLTNGKI